MNQVFRPFIALFLFAACFLPGDAEGQTSSPVVLQVLAKDPESTSLLPLNRTLYFKIGYSCDQPLRLQATGRFQGEDFREILNPSPVYPAGSGEGLVWISYRSPRKIDEVVITAFDERWNPLGTLSVPVFAEWRAEVPDSSPASWVREMSDAQQAEVARSMSRAAEESGPFDGILFLVLSVSVFGYPILQIYSLWKDGWKSLSGIPLLGMLPLLLYTAFAFVMESNLWPLLFLFACPFAFLYLLIIRLFVRKKSS